MAFHDLDLLRTTAAAPSTPGASGADVLARLAARLAPGALDRALVAGSDPARSPRLAARAALLTAPATRAALADAIDSLLSRARGPRPMLADRASVLASAEQLTALAGTLRGPAPLYARGVAIVSELLADGTGPLYRAGARAATGRTLEDARRALAGAA